MEIAPPFDSILDGWVSTCREITVKLGERGSGDGQAGGGWKTVKDISFIRGLLDDVSLPCEYHDDEEKRGTYLFNGRGRDTVLGRRDVAVSVRALKLFIDKGTSGVDPCFLPLLVLEVI
jgi:hypothetical protein